jgi:hypothetical protein
MKSVIESMYENQVWSLVDPPKGSRPIECKWIYKKKKTLAEIFLSIKLDLSQKSFDKFKELTTMRLSLL